MPTRTLRQNGVYKLPDGREIVVGAGSEGRYFMYYRVHWGKTPVVLYLPVAYEVDGEGRLLTGGGRPTEWLVDDLRDTGFSA